MQYLERVGCHWWAGSEEGQAKGPAPLVPQSLFKLTRQPVAMDSGPGLRHESASEVCFCFISCVCLAGWPPGGTACGVCWSRHTYQPVALTDQTHPCFARPASSQTRFRLTYCVCYTAHSRGAVGGSSPSLFSSFYILVDLLTVCGSSLYFP